MLCWLCETAKFFYTSYIDVNINIKLCFVSQRSSDTESVMTQMEMLAVSSEALNKALRRQPFSFRA